MLTATIKTIIIGFIISLIAHLIKPDDSRLNFVFTILIGITGAFLGRFAGVALGIYHPDEPAALVAALAGSAIVLALLSFINTGSITHPR